MTEVQDVVVVRDTSLGRMHPDWYSASDAEWGGEHHDPQAVIRGLALEDLDARTFFTDTRTGTDDAPDQNAELRTLYRDGPLKEFLLEAVIARKDITTSQAAGTVDTMPYKFLSEIKPNIN